jgi:hypothetical protein
MFDQVLKTVESTADSLLKRCTHFPEHPRLGAAFTKETNGKSEREQNVDEGGPVVSYFSHDVLYGNHLNFEWPMWEFLSNCFGTAFSCVRRRL